MERGGTRLIVPHQTIINQGIARGWNEVGVILTPPRPTAPPIARARRRKAKPTARKDTSAPSLAEAGGKAYNKG